MAVGVLHWNTQLNNRVLSGRSLHGPGIQRLTSTCRPGAEFTQAAVLHPIWSLMNAMRSSTECIRSCALDGWLPTYFLASSPMFSNALRNYAEGWSAE